MAVALATSTPTSTTVVETSTSTSPAAKADIVASFSSGGSRPWRAATRSPDSGPSASSATTSSTAARGRCSPAGGSGAPSAVASAASWAPCSSSPLMRGHTTYAWWPAATSSRSRAQTRASQPGASASGTTVVWIAARPAGSSRSVEVSRSPKTVIATVRGIGVAVMTSTCGGLPALSVRAARCSTPKRCCSSTTTRPRSANCTVSCSSAWVPTTIPASPEAASSSGSVRCALVIDPVSRWTRVASGGRRACRRRRGRRASR